MTKSVLDQIPQKVDKIFQIVPLELRNIVEDIEKELERVMFTSIDESMPREMNVELKKRVNARYQNGAGACFLDNGDLYSG